MNARLVTPLIKHKQHSAVEHVLLNDAEQGRLILTVHYNGMIAECNRDGGKLLDCLPSELVWQPISKLLPKLQNIALVQGQNVNPYLNFLSRAGYLFELQTLKGVHMACRVFFCEVGCMGQRFLRVIICPQAQEVILSMR